MKLSARNITTSIIDGYIHIILPIGGGNYRSYRLKLDSKIAEILADYIPLSQKGVANGVASLGVSGKVPESQLPSYIDEVQEYANLAAFPLTGSLDVIYVALDTNFVYRWSGSTYVQIVSGAVISVNGQTGAVTLLTSDITEDTDKNYVTDAQLVVIGQTSGINTGDEDATSILTKLGITVLSGDNTGDETESSILTKLGITTISGDNTGDQKADDDTIKGDGSIGNPFYVNPTYLGGISSVTTDETLEGTGTVLDPLTVKEPNLWDKNIIGGNKYKRTVLTDSRNIANTGWHAPTQQDFEDLITTLGGETGAGGKLKVTGTTYWTTPNTGATNSSGFNARGTGNFTQLGVAELILTEESYYCSDSQYAYTLAYNSADFTNADLASDEYGFPVRLIKDTTTLSDGETGYYIGNDGQQYNTICIGTQEWLSENLVETKFRNLELISFVDNATDWQANVIGCYAYYNYTESNSFDGIRTKNNLPIAGVIPVGSGMEIDGTNSDIDHLNFNLTPPTFSGASGTLGWDVDNETLSFGHPDGGIIQINQEIFDIYTNLSGVQLVNGDIVAVTSATGNRTAVTLADSTNQSISESTIGMVTVPTINNSNSGRITKNGKVRDLNTNAYNEGDKIYVDPANPGKWTSTRPSYPNVVIRVGTVTVKSATVGVIDVDIHIDLNNYQNLHGFSTMPASPSFTGNVYSLPGSTPYIVYINGIKYRITTEKTLDISALAEWTGYTFAQRQGQWFIWMYILNGVPTLNASKTAWDILDTSAIPVDTAYANDNGAGAIEWIISKEKHADKRNLLMHKQEHDTDGARWVSGLNSLTVGSGAVNNSTNTFSLAGGVIRDEDIYHTISNPQTTCRIGYKNGSTNAMIFDAAGTTYAKLNAGVPRYDNAGTLTDIDSAKYGIIWQYATNRITVPIVHILGQNQYASVSAAQAASQPTLYGLSVAEWKVINRIIIRNVGGALNWIQTDPLYQTTTGPAVGGGGVSQLPAGNITVSPFGTISSTNVQSALDELEKDAVIYKPSTQPAIVLGSPNLLTLDCNSYRQAMFEPRESVGTLTIDIDFDIDFTNDTTTDFIEFVLSLSGTRVLSFPSDVICNNESSSGSWNNSNQELTLVTTTDEVIKFQLSRYTTNSKWILSVSEKAV